MINFKINATMISYDYCTDYLKKILVADEYGDTHLLSITRKKLDEADKLQIGGSYVITGTQKAYGKATKSGNVIHRNTMYVSKIHSTEDYNSTSNSQTDDADNKVPETAER